MHITQLLSQLNEEPLYAPLEKYNVTTIEQYEQAVIKNEPEYFNQKITNPKDPDTRKKVSAGLEHKRTSDLPIPRVAYPFYTDVVQLYEALYKQAQGKQIKGIELEIKGVDVAARSTFDVFVKVAKTLNRNVYSLGNDSDLINDIFIQYNTILTMLNKKNQSDPTTKALDYMVRYYRNLGTKTAEEIDKKVQTPKEDNNDDVEIIGKFSDGENLSRGDLHKYIKVFLESRKLLEFTLDDLESDKKNLKYSDQFMKEFLTWFQKEVVESNSRDKIEQYIKSSKGIEVIKNEFVKAKGEGLDQEELKRFLTSKTKKKEDSEEKPEKTKDPKEDSEEKPKDDPEEKEAENEPDTNQKTREVKEILSSIGIQKIRDQELLDSLIQKYPNESAENISTAYALMDPESPDSMPIEIGGEKFTKKELISLLKGLKESFIYVMKEDMLYEFNIVKRLQKLNALIKSGKTKEDLVKGRLEPEEDVKGYAAQVNRIKEKALKSTTRQISIGKKMRDMLAALDVPTSKLKTRENLKSLGAGAFDSIIKGLNTQTREEDENK